MCRYIYIYIYIYAHILYMRPMNEPDPRTLTLPGLWPLKARSCQEWKAWEQGIKPRTLIDGEALP